MFSTNPAHQQIMRKATANTEDFTMKKCARLATLLAHMILACSCFGFGVVRSAQAETYYSWTWIGYVDPYYPEIPSTASGVLGVDATNSINYVTGELNGQTINGLSWPALLDFPINYIPNKNSCSTTARDFNSSWTIQIYGA